MQIDPIYWKVWWQAIAESHDAKQLLYSVSPDQLDCKKWLVDNLPTFNHNRIKIQLFGGWYGYPLIDMLVELYGEDIKRITNIDIDPKATSLCRRFTNLKNLKDMVDEKTQDVSAELPSDSSTDLIINTSSEHMPPLPKLIAERNFPKTCVFAIQSNNMDYVDDHTNCVSSEEELINQSGLSYIIYSGTHKMNNGYERYMVIGRR